MQRICKTNRTSWQIERVPKSSNISTLEEPSYLTSVWWEPFRSSKCGIFTHVGSQPWLPKSSSPWMLGLYSFTIVYKKEEAGRIFPTIWRSWRCNSNTYLPWRVSLWFLPLSSPVSSKPVFFPLYPLQIQLTSTKYTLWSENILVQISINFFQNMKSSCMYSIQSISFLTNLTLNSVEFMGVTLHEPFVY